MLSHDERMRIVGGFIDGLNAEGIGIGFGVSASRVRQIAREYENQTGVKVRSLRRDNQAERWDRFCRRCGEKFQLRRRGDGKGVVGHRKHCYECSPDRVTRPIDYYGPVHICEDNFYDPDSESNRTGSGSSTAVPGREAQAKASK